MKLRSLLAAVLFLVAGVSVGVGGCSMLTPGNTPSVQVLTDIRNAELAFNVAQTILTIEAVDSGKEIDPNVKLAEDAVYALLQAAKDAANKGDTVTMNDKLDLFNVALKDFNDKYVSDHTTQPATLPAK